MEKRLQELLEQCRPYIKEGRVASYIPELTKANPDHFGVYIMDSDGVEHCAGDWDQEFTIQSIAKTILLLLALIDNGEEAVRARVGVEATGKAFDAINMGDQVLLREHINPMVNMGAIAMCSLIKGASYAERFDRLLALTRRLADNPGLTLNEDVYHSEKTTGNKNRAFAYLLKAYGLMEDDPMPVVDCYFKSCSINVTCRDLANIAAVLAHHGRHPRTGEQLFPARYARFVNAVLMTCGMYDGSGDFAIKVGIPAKSGVGGGIMAVAPGRTGFGIFSPCLDKRGNSCAGIHLLEQLSQEMDLSVF